MLNAWWELLCQGALQLNVCIVQFSAPGISGVLEEVHANNLHLFPKGNKICDKQTCLSRLPEKQN